MDRAKILSIIIFLALVGAVIVLVASGGLRGWNGWTTVVFIGVVMAVYVALGWRARAKQPAVSREEVVAAVKRSLVTHRVTVRAAARVRSRTDTQGLLGALYLLDLDGRVMAIRDPFADEAARAGRFPAETVIWRRNYGGALVELSGEGEARPLAWDLEAPGAIGVSDGEVLEGTLELALERASGLSVSGGRQVL